MEERFCKIPKVAMDTFVTVDCRYLYQWKVRDDIYFLENTEVPLYVSMLCCMLHFDFKNMIKIHS